MALACHKDVCGNCTWTTPICWALGCRWVGQPRLWLLECVTGDWKNFCIMNWRRIVKDTHTHMAESWGRSKGAPRAFELLLLLIIIIIILIYYYLLVISQQSTGESRCQQDIKLIYPSTLQMMCAVLSVICSSMADGWPGSDWRFWFDPFLIVPDAPVITDTIFVLSTSSWPDLQVFVLF